MVQGVLSKFIDRFRALTVIAHMAEKWRIVPVVHHASSLQTSTWRLDPELKIVNLNKQLPYSKVGFRVCYVAKCSSFCWLLYLLTSLN